MFDLSNRVALVTGSNRGIGYALALGLAQLGADVYIHCRKRGQQADDVLRQIADMGVRGQVIYGDLALVDAAGQMKEQMEASMGLPDILVLNASYQIRSPLESVTKADFDLQMQVDLFSSLQLMQVCIPAMQAKRWGRIVTIGSIQQVKPHPEMLPYAAAKMGQLSMVQNLAAQLAPCGITVNNVAPGTIFTDRNTEVLSDAAYKKKVEDDIPMRYIGKPEDCVAPVVMLCSNEARYITGVDLLVDGGKHL